MRFRSIGARLCLGALAAWLASCSSSAASGPAGSGATSATDVKVVASLDLDGDILMLAYDSNNTQIHVLDPSTGKASALVSLVNLADPREAFAVSPDGQRIAWIAAQKANGFRDVIVAEVQDQDGVPTFHTVQTFADTTADRVRWNLQGDRVYTKHLWLDVQTGQAHDCLTGAVSTDLTLAPIAPMPDGELFACPASAGLYDDGRRVAETSASGEALNADGQYLYSGLHVPSWTMKPLGKNEEVDGFFSALQAVTRLPDGRWGSFVGGINGKHVVEEPSVPGSSVYVKKILDMHDPQLDGTVWNVAKHFAEGSAKSEGTYKFAGVLEPFMHQGDGRGWGAFAMTGDGSAVIWMLRSWKIEYDPVSGDPNEAMIDTVVAQVDAAGTVRSFRLSALGLNANVAVGPAPTFSGVLDLPEGDWLIPTSGQADTWVGYLHGKAVAIGDGGLLAQGGTLLLRAGPHTTKEGFTICTRSLHQRDVAATVCVPQPHPGSPVAMVAQGSRATHAGDPPLILAIQRRAAWTGSTVRIDGAHFGSQGTLSVGGVPVPASAITEWSDRHIRWTMSDALPADGVVQVTTAQGTAGQTAQFRVARTAAWQSPFAQVSHLPHSVAQGLNLLELGDLTAFSPKAGPHLTFHPSATTAPGTFVVWSAGASPATSDAITLTSGAYRFTVPVAVQDAIATTDTWQLPLLASGDISSQHPAFVTIAGDLIERKSALHPVLGTRLQLRMATSPTGQGTGLPQSFQEIAGGALAINHVDGMPDAAGWTLSKLTGWIGADGLWGTAQYAPGSSVSLPNYFQGAAAQGSTVIAVGGDPMGAPGGAWQISTDGGKTFGTTHLAPAKPPTQALQFPLLVDAASGAFVLALDAAYNAPQVLGVHGISLDGTFMPNIAELPPETVVNGGTVKTAPLSVTSDKGRAVLHFQGTQTLAMVDFDLPGTAPRPWQILPDAAAKGHVVSYFHEPQSHDLYVVLDNGPIQRATAAVKWNNFKVIDLGISLSVPAKVLPLTLGKMADGRWLVLAHLLAPDGKSPGLLGETAWLVGK